MKAPRLPVWGWCLVGLAAVLALAFWPVMARQQTLLPLLAGVTPLKPGPRFMLDPMAPAWFSYPLGVLASRIWQAGEVPLWNVFSSCGEPLLAGVHAGVTSLFRLWYVLVEPTPALWDFYCLARLLSAGAGALLLGMTLGLSASGAFACAVAYMLSGFMVANVSLSMLDAEVWLPVLAAGVIRFMARPSPASWCLCVLAGGGVLMLGNGQVALVDGVFVASLASVLAIRSGRAQTRRSLIAVSLAGLASLGLGAPALMSALEFLPRAQHIHEEAGMTAIPLWGSLSLAVPWVLGRFGEAWKGVNPFFFLPYAGITVLALAAAGAWKAWKHPAGPVFCLIPGVMLAATYGVPPASWLGHLPGFSMLWWAKYQAPTYLGLAVLAGFGVDACARLLARRRRAKKAGWGFAALICAELLVLVPAGRPPVHDPLAPAPYVEFLREHMDPINDRIYATGFWLHPQTGAGLGLRDVRSFYGVMPRRTYWYMRGLVTGPARNSHEALMTGSPRARPAIDSAALAALSVRWLITDRYVMRRGLPDHFRLRFSSHALVYENLAVQPRVRLVKRAVRVSDARQALYETSGAPADERTIYVEGPDDWPGFLAPVGNGRPRIQSDGPNHVLCEVSGGGTRIVLLADTWERGWKAWAGRRRLMVLPANCMFRAVAVPDGESQVLFRYDPFPLKFGLMMAGMSAGVTLFVLALGGIRRGGVRSGRKRR